MSRIDIAYKISLFSKFLASPRTGHTYQALHVFKSHVDNDLSLDPLYQKIESLHNPQTLIREMRQIYVDAAEDLPTNAPTLQGKSIQLNFFVGADHCGDQITRRS